MSDPSAFDRCLTFINCQLHTPADPLAHNGTGWRAVTISRQAGSGAHVIGEKLAELLQSQRAGESRPWTLFDRNLVKRVLDDHHLPARLAAFMPEDRAPGIADTLENIFGLHPPAEALVQKTSETILHLVELGHVVLIGRGANILTRRISGVFHVRLVAHLDKRLAYVQRTLHLDEKAALAFIRREDRGRQRYVQQYFHEDINNPLLYHLVINTGLVDYDQAAALIADVVSPLTLLPPRTLAP